MCLKLIKVNEKLKNENENTKTIKRNTNSTCAFYESEIF